MNKVLTETLWVVRMTGLATYRVFCNQYGVPYPSFCTAFARAVRKASLVDVMFHDLQHIFASWLVISGLDLPTVQEFVGHKMIAMTLRYTHLSSDHKHQAVTVLKQCADTVPSIFPTEVTN